MPTATPASHPPHPTLFEQDIYHERAWVDTDISSVRVKCIVETADRASARAMFEMLAASGYDVETAKLPATGKEETPLLPLLTGTPERK